MFTIKQTDEFTAWIDGIKDGMTRRRLGRRLEKAQAGNFGDVEPVGEGVSEMREHFGPGWRMYYVQQANACARYRCCEEIGCHYWGLDHGQESQNFQPQDI